MAVVKFSRKEFEKYIKIDKKIEQKIAMFGTPLEYLNDEEIAIEIFPNRPDLLSLQGYLRAFLTFIGKKKKFEYKVNKPEKNYEIKISHSVRGIRPYTACAIVKNLKFDDEKIKEIIDVQEKIHSTLGRNRKKIAIGIYPLEKIALPIKFEARSPKDIKFVPLEANREMNGFEILKEHPTGREYGYLLQSFKKYPVFVDSAGEILSMPPIINSEKTGKITEKTKDVFIECSGFDFNYLKKTLNILVTMLADMGGEIYQMKLDYGLRKEVTPNLEPEKIKINFGAINKLLGLELNEKQVKELLSKMGYEYNNGEVSVPPWRVDVLHEVDIAEDIAIAYGYDKFQDEIPEISTIGKENERERLKRKISEILIGLNFLEISSYHLLTRDDLKKQEKKEFIEIEKSRTDYCFLRANLLISALKILSENVDAEYPQKLFEIGTVFKKNEEKETGIEEKENLCIVVAPGNFTDVKQVLNYVGKMLNYEVELEETTAQNFIEGRTGKILIEGKEAGIMGEIHPSALREWHLKMPVAALEVDFDFLIKKFLKDKVN
ncbi:MAG: phenylalanine--tRNA ligase subunit beta [Candidatus Pacearchaeota archaeon]|nr:phenylalanine--tRNA ligase subunit beta [Candidatus Pacearchaeota archaeon]